MIGLTRQVLRAWGRWGKAPGWYYQTVESLGPRLSAGRRFSVTLPNGCRMECDLKEQVERLIYFLGAYEPVESYLMTKLLRPGMVVVDAGANVGQYSLLAATAVGPQGSVHAFEPVPATFDRLASHVCANQSSNVSVNRAALWHETATLQLAQTPEMAHNAGAFSVGIFNPKTTVDALAMRLDDYLAERSIESVDFIKLDVEGAELSALRGMSGLLERCRPLLMMEICRYTCERLGYHPHDLWELLSGRYGYRAWLIGDSPMTCRPLDSLEGVEQQNVLFHVDDLSPVLTQGWSLKSCLHWARTRGRS